MFSRIRAFALSMVALQSLMTSGVAAREAPLHDAEIANITLNNGMEVVATPDHQAPIVTQMVWYKVGNANEPPGKSGIAHFLEYLMFKGTKKRPAGEFGAKIAEIGVRRTPLRLPTTPPAIRRFHRRPSGQWWNSRLTGCAISYSPTQ